jgi:conjugal transfer pilus assembly protein TraW
MLLELPMQYSNAYDFGIIGTATLIQEENMLEYIQAKLLRLQESGVLALRQEGMKELTQSKVNRPKSIEGIKLTSEAKEWLYDPSFTLKEDIKDEKGNVIHEAGKIINPLDQMPLKEKLLFIDGDDDAQVKWAIKESKDAKIILVNGSPQDLMKINKIRFYFDQQGVLVQKFGIKYVPVIVSQKGKRILITEVSLDRGAND